MMLAYCETIYELAWQCPYCNHYNLIDEPGEDDAEICDACNRLIEDVTYEQVGR